MRLEVRRRGGGGGGGGPPLLKPLKNNRNPQPARPRRAEHESGLFFLVRPAVTEIWDPERTRKEGGGGGGRPAILPKTPRASAEMRNINLRRARLYLSLEPRGGLVFAKYTIHGVLRVVWRFLTRGSAIVGCPRVRDPALVSQCH